MAARTRKPKPVDLTHIAAELQSLAVPVADLKPDPQNARKHGDRNRETVVASLRRFGQQFPVVALADGTVIAGNARLDAAIALGWTHLAVVRFRDRESAKAFALADNRTAELAEWDTALLQQQLDDLGELDFDLGEIGFSDDDLADLLDDPPDATTPQPSPEPRGKPETTPESNDQSAALPDGYRVLVECSDEAAQQDLLARLTQEGFECRALIV
jgi:hypothetical protein